MIDNTETEQTTIVYAQCDRWTSYDVINIWQPLMLYQYSSKGKEESAFLRQSLSRAISRLSIILSLRSLPSLVKMEKSS